MKLIVHKPPFQIDTDAGQFTLEVFIENRIRLSRPGTIMILEHGSEGYEVWHVQKIVAQGKRDDTEQIVKAFTAWRGAHPRTFSMLEKLAIRDKIKLG